MLPSCERCIEVCFWGNKNADIEVIIYFTRHVFRVSDFFDGKPSFLSKLLYLLCYSTTSCIFAMQKFVL
ncbi:hypothetical protein SDC9_76815 [bioreactor metagenome]|uniref:Uncharacterized protein n=1 Tax=bioreactor metagenome TaxID=1076179 RepID=A0A644YPR0_9ZZZZ